MFDSRLFVAVALFVSTAIGCASQRATVVSTEEVNEVVGGIQPGPGGVAGAPAGAPAADPNAEAERLRAEILRLRTELAVAGANSAAITGAPSPAPTPSSAVPPPDTAAAAAGAEAIRVLRAQLEQEQTRRLALEQELARIKAETGSPLTLGRQVPETELFAVKQELVDLRRALDAERAVRERLSGDVAALQGTQPAAAGGDAELQARVQTLQQEKDKIVAELNQSLAASQARTKELEAALVAKGDPGAAAAVVDVAGAHAENAELRQRLEDERRRSEDLEAKLQVANRLADLIFRMEQQQKKVPKPKPKPKPPAVDDYMPVPATGTVIPPAPPPEMAPPTSP